MRQVSPMQPGFFDRIHRYIAAMYLCLASMYLCRTMPNCDRCANFHPQIKQNKRHFMLLAFARRRSPILTRPRGANRMDIGRTSAWVTSAGRYDRRMLLLCSLHGSVPPGFMMLEYHGTWGSRPTPRIRGRRPPEVRAPYHRDSHQFFELWSQTLFNRHETPPRLHSH